MCAILLAKQQTLCISIKAQFEVIFKQINKLMHIVSS